MSILIEREAQRNSVTSARPESTPNLPAQQRPKVRHPGLDALRCLAIILVLGRHMLYGLPDGRFVRPIFDAWVRGGWTGVDLFFVLSGFLISGLLFTEFRRDGKISMGRFFVRRGWRIYPPFIVLIAFTVIYNRLTGTHQPARFLWSELTFMQSYFEGMWWQTWSLSVEEHFYILLPVALAFILSERRYKSEPLRILPLCIGVLALATLIFRIVHARLVPFNLQTHTFASYLRMDSLAFGVLIAYYYHFEHERFVSLLTPYRHLMLIGGILLLAPDFILEQGVVPYIHTFGYTVTYIGCGMLLTGTLLTDLSRSRWIGIFAAIGAYSYSIYLWHLAVSQKLILYVVTRFDTPDSFWFWFSFYVAGSIVVGVVMAKLIEMPSLAIRDRLYPTRSSGAVAAQELHQDALNA